jgi:hypothetical protein
MERGEKGGRREDQNLNFSRKGYHLWQKFNSRLSENQRKMVKALFSFLYMV